MRKPSKHCLLVVDDEPDLVSSVKDLLRLDYRVLGATRASEGLRIMEQEQVHIVMSDQRMPEMSGVEFLAQLRDRFPDTVRLLFTAYSELKPVIDAINQGNVYRYITKPWEPQELQAVLLQAAEHYDLLLERKRLLAELQKQNEALEKANEELRQANELKKAFIKVASHELRTPLTITLGLADLARQTPGVAPPLSQWLERIYLGSCRLNERVNQMIKLLMADTYERTLARQAVDAAHLLRSAVNDVQSFIDTRKQKLDVAVPADLGMIAVEEDKIRDSVLQLLVNAIKFTPDGGTIRLAAERQSSGTLTIAVTDTGMGIDAVSQTHIFEPFFTRFDVSRHSSGVYEYDRRGLGLGLSVAKAFVEMHGGRVRLESTIGKGSTFTIELPSHAHDQAAG